jgi:hypothetical protein
MSIICRLDSILAKAINDNSKIANGSIYHASLRKRVLISLSILFCKMYTSFDHLFAAVCTRFDFPTSWPFFSMHTTINIVFPESF